MEPAAPSKPNDLLGKSNESNLDGVTVMISHSTISRPTSRASAAPDLGLADNVFANLEAQEAHVLLSTRTLTPGTDWQTDIYRRWLHQCHAAVILLGPEALASEPVRDEAVILKDRWDRGSLASLVIALIDGVKVGDVLTKWGDASGWRTYQFNELLTNATNELASEITGLVIESAMEHGLVQKAVSKPIRCRAEYHAKEYLPESNNPNAIDKMVLALEKIQPHAFGCTGLEFGVLRRRLALEWCTTINPKVGARHLTFAQISAGVDDPEDPMFRLIEYFICGRYDSPDGNLLVGESSVATHGAVLPCRSTPEAQLALKGLTTGHSDIPDPDVNHVCVIAPPPSAMDLVDDLIRDLEQTLADAEDADDEGISLLDDLSRCKESGLDSPIYALIYVGSDQISMFRADVATRLSATFGAGFVPLFYGEDPGLLAQTLRLPLLSVCRGEALTTFLDAGQSTLELQEELNYEVKRSRGRRRRGRIAQQNRSPAAVAQRESKPQTR